MLPNLLVVGAMKAGTTSLHYYLSQHPEIFMSEDKEPTFFTVEKNWHRGVPWYSSLFPEGTAIRGESSPDYTKFPAIQGVPERLHSVVPDARLLYLVREPVARIVSHWVDSYSYGRTHKPIDQELARYEDHHYVNCSRYHMQIEQYLERFDRSRLLVVTTEALHDAPERTMGRIFRFLEVDPSFTSPEFETVLYTAEEKRRKTRAGYALVGLAQRVKHSPLRPFLSPRLMAPVRAFNKRAAKPIARPALADSLRQELVECLRPDVARLRELTGESLSEWPAFS
jgi:hypothetical protein